MPPRGKDNERARTRSRSRRRDTRREADQHARAEDETPVRPGRSRAQGSKETPSSRDYREARDDQATQRHSDMHRNDYKGSPKLFDMKTTYNLDADLPDSYIQNDVHLDATEMWGLKLPQHVTTSQFSKDKDIAGKDVRTIRIIDLCYKGIENHGLRTLAAGRFVNIEFTRSTKESVFIHTLLQQLRGTQDKSIKNTGIDLDLIAQKLASDNNKPFSSLADKKWAYNEIANKVAEVLQTMLPKTAEPQVDKAVYDIIKTLQQQVADLTKAQTTETPAKKPRTLHQSVHMGKNDTRHEEDAQE